MRWTSPNLKKISQRLRLVQPTFLAMQLGVSLDRGMLNSWKPARNDEKLESHKSELRAVRARGLKIPTR
jgi:hypothetical protein